MGIGEQLREARAEVCGEWQAPRGEGEAGGGPPAAGALPFELRHALPGRLRVAFPVLIHRHGSLERLVCSLRERPGVRRVSVNRLCASLTIDYDDAAVPQSALLDGLKRLTPEDLAPAASPEPGQARPRAVALPRTGPAPRGRPRILWAVAGSFFVGLSGLGVILPGLPTAPFVLLAGYCYLRGSERLYVWLVNHRVFGRFVEETGTGVRIARKARKVTVVLLWVSIAISCTFFLQALALRLLMIGTGVGVSFYLLRDPKNV